MFEKIKLPTKKMARDDQKAKISQLKGFVAILCSTFMSLCMFGCSSEPTVTDTKKERVVVQKNCGDEEDNRKKNGALSLTGGTQIDIPDEFDSVQMNEVFSGYYCLGYGGANCYWAQEGKGWAAGEVYREWKDKQNMPHEDDGLVLIDGRVGVVCKPIFGEAGDYVDVVYKDGNVLHGIIIDHKGTENEGIGVPWEKYGHGNNSYCDVMEWYLDEKNTGNGNCSNCPLFKNRKNDPDYGFVFGIVDYFVNYGNRSQYSDGSTVANSDVSTTSTTSAADGGSSVKSAGNIKITTHDIWSAGRSDPHTDPTPKDFPVDKYIETGSHDGSGGDASACNPDASMLSDENLGHDTLSQIMYIVLHTTESNTDSAANIITAWNNASGDRKGVGAHFLVEPTGKIYQSVSMDKTAWHAGGGGSTNAEQFKDIPEGKAMNGVSIGIEIVHDSGEEYPAEQLKAVDDLIAYIKKNAGDMTISNDKNKSEQCKSGESSKSKDNGGFTGEEADNIWFKQWEYEDKCYNDGTTIHAGGCGLCAITCCIDILLGQKYTPPEVDAKMKASGKTYHYNGRCADSSTCTATAEEYGLKTSKITDINSAKDALTSGKCIWVGGSGPYKDASGQLKSHGHCVMFYKIVDGEYYCHDSGVNANPTKYSEDELSNIIKNSDGGSGCYAVYK